MNAFCIDLDNSLEILDFSGEELEYDMRHYNASQPTDLSDYDRKVFNSEAEAEAYLERYTATLEGLSERARRDLRLPCMLLKRRYIVQVMLGEKHYTIRPYKKAWEPGQLFQFHDQINFLTVRLTSLTQTIDKEWKYTHELPA
jgi:hypothetical protein